MMDDRLQKELQDIQEKLHVAEQSRLAGERTYTTAEMQERLVALIDWASDNEPMDLALASEASLAKNSRQTHETCCRIEKHS